MKKTILIDLDGVLNNYTGNFDETFIPQIKDGAESFLKLASENFVIKIFTTRNKLMTAKWLIENQIDKYITDITGTKELCWIYIDDRCIKFKGDYEKLMGEIKNFLAWYKSI